MRRVEVVIDELVLRGVEPAHAHAAAAALESRLTALAQAHEGPLRERAESSRRLEPIAVVPQRLGERVAEAVWGAIA